MSTKDTKDTKDIKDKKGGVGCTKKDEYSLVVGIDLGAYGTGLSLAYKSVAGVAQVSTFPPLPFAANPKDLLDSSNAWRQQSGKVPTKVALNATTLKLLAFGNSVEPLWAEELRNEKAERPHAPKVRIFDNIKAVLDFANNSVVQANKQANGGRSVALRDKVMVPDRRDNPIPALQLLTIIFAHLKDSAMARLPHNTIPVRWVICVPACWDEAAKQFMLEAAAAAGLYRAITATSTRSIAKADDLGLQNEAILALESESAAVASHHHVIQTQKQLFKTSAASSASASSSSKSQPPPSKVDGKLSMAVPVTVEMRQRYLAPGSKCLMVDGGGHTFDCTMHEVDVDGRLIKAAHSAGAWGGRLWNAEFAKMMDHSFGGDWMRLFDFHYPEEAFEMSENIEALKREIDPAHADTKEYRLELPNLFVTHTKLADHGTTKVVITLNSDPTGTRNLSSPAEPLKNTNSSSDTKTVAVAKTVTVSKTVTVDKEDDSDEWSEGAVEDLPLPTKLKVRVCGSNEALPADGKRLCYSHGALLISQRLAMSMFDEPIKHIREHIQHLCTNNPSLSTVKLAGGFCQSSVVRATIQQVVNTANLDRRKNQQKSPEVDEKKDDILVMTVENPSTAVLVGAALYGLQTDIIRTRVMRQALGTNVAVPWDETHKVEHGCFKHPRSYWTANGLVKDAQCFNHFKRFVNAGDVVGVNDLYTHTFAPCQAGQREMTFNLYSTTDPTIDRVTTLPLIGQITVPMPCGEGGLNRSIKLQLSYGGTRIQATATDTTTDTNIHATFTFLD